jgi:hypothetical protein
VSEHQGPETHGPEERVDLTGLSRLSDKPPPPKGENAIRIARALSVLLLAVAAAGLPWYFVTRGGDTNGDAGGPGPRQPGATSPSPSPTATTVTYEIVNVGDQPDDCLNIRAEPSTQSKRLDCLTKDVRLTGDGKTQEGGGRLWRHVYDPLKKMWGWAADEYLKPVG